MEFIAIDENNYRECLRLRIKDDQLEYMSSSNAHALAKAYVHRDSAFPYAIYENDKMIGFFQYRNMDNIGNYLIDKIMIDKEQQGKGYGKKAMTIIMEKLMKESKFRKICLCVDLRNINAIKLYESLGFKQCEDEEEGEIVLGFE